MKVSLMLKINYLILGLGLIIYAMYYLDRFGLGANFSQLLGINQPQKIERKATFEKAKR